MTVRVETDNSLLNNMDMSKRETKLQKEIAKKKQQHQDEEAAKEQA